MILDTDPIPYKRVTIVIDNGDGTTLTVEAGRCIDVAVQAPSDDGWMTELRPDRVVLGPVVTRLALSLTATALPHPTDAAVPVVTAVLAGSGS